MIVAILSSQTHICRKCGGSVAIREDLYGKYISCLMCGTTREDLLIPDTSRPTRGRVATRETVSRNVPHNNRRYPSGRKNNRR